MRWLWPGWTLLVGLLFLSTLLCDRADTLRSSPWVLSVVLLLVSLALGVWLTFSSFVRIRVSVSAHHIVVGRRSIPLRLAQALRAALEARDAREPEDQEGRRALEEFVKLR